MTSHIKVCIFICNKIGCYLAITTFEWDTKKEELNEDKHGVSFKQAQLAFADPKRVIAKDLEHSKIESRYYCFGKLNEGIITVRFTYRENKIRIIGAGNWRKGKQIYEKENKIHK